MSQPAHPIDFPSLLALEPDGEDLFSVTLHDYGDGRGFGGDLLGRALLAARRTTDPARRIFDAQGQLLASGSQEGLNPSGS